MKSKRKRFLVVGLVLSLLFVSGLACSAGGGRESPEVTIDIDEDGVGTVEVTPVPSATEPPTVPPEPTEPMAAVPDVPGTASPEPASTLPPEPQPPQDVTDPLELANIPELEVYTLDPTGGGLGNLGTFRQRMTVSFTAEDADYSGTYFYDAEVNTADQAVHITLRVEGPIAQQLPANTMEAIWVGTRLWIRLGNQPWFPVPQDVAAAQFDEQFLAVGDFLPYTDQFERVGEESVNGISSAHYIYDVENVETQSGVVSGAGDVYVALDGGYVVRYTLSGSGNFSNEFQSSGTIDLLYETYDVGADIQIHAPRR
jgi:hypothetical protein